jgi:peroxiredoxin Q/BCP
VRSSHWISADTLLPGWRMPHISRSKLVARSVIFACPGWAGRSSGTSPDRGSFDAASAASGGGRMLKVGDAAPKFVLPDADMETVDIEQYLGQSHVILFFYPRDGAPVCTQEATDFSDHEDEFVRQDCVVFGISRDDCLKHAEFRDKNGISVRLLADTDAAVCKRYGVWQLKEVDGVRKHAIVRSTFILDRQGILRFVQYGVPAKGHALEILRAVKELNS